MNHLGLFEGIGGFAIAARWMNWKTVAWCEINPFCQKVLKYHFPEAEGHSDIKETDFTKYANRIDILTGGFPCQPFSTAGKRLGKEDERHLFPEMLRAIREVQPSWIVGENVSGLLNWNGGLVLDEIKTDLESSGFEVFPPCVLPACGVNAPHRRDRVWIVAYSDSNRNRNIERQNRKTNSLPKLNRKELCAREFIGAVTGIIADPYSGEQGEIRRNDAEDSTNKTRKAWSENNPFILGGNTTKATANANNERLESGSLPIGNDEKGRQKQGGRFKQSSVYVGRALPAATWENFPTQSPLCSGNDGLSGELAGITFSKHRAESIKAYGNAVVPQIPFEIFKAIEAYQSQLF